MDLIKKRIRVQRKDWLRLATKLKEQGFSWAIGFEIGPEDEDIFDDHPVIYVHVECPGSVFYRTPQDALLPGYTTVTCYDVFGEYEETDDLDWISGQIVTSLECGECDHVWTEDVDVDGCRVMCPECHSEFLVKVK